MPLQLHDNEGVLYLNEDGTWSGQVMFHNVVFNVRGEVGISARGKTYMQLRAKERNRIEIRPASAPRSTRKEKLAKALENVKAMYGAGSRLKP